MKIEKNICKFGHGTDGRWMAHIVRLHLYFDRFLFLRFQTLDTVNFKRQLLDFLEYDQLLLKLLHLAQGFQRLLLLQISLAEAGHLGM